MGADGGLVWTRAQGTGSSASPRSRGAAGQPCRRVSLHRGPSTVGATQAGGGHPLVCRAPPESIAELCVLTILKGLGFPFITYLW